MPTILITIKTTLLMVVFPFFVQNDGGGRLGFSASVVSMPPSVPLSATTARLRALHLLFLSDRHSVVVIVANDDKIVMCPAGPHVIRIIYWSIRRPRRLPPIATVQSQPDELRGGHTVSRAAAMMLPPWRCSCRHCCPAAARHCSLSLQLLL